MAILAFFTDPDFHSTFSWIQATRWGLSADSKRPYAYIVLSSPTGHLYQPLKSWPTNERTPINTLRKARRRQEILSDTSPTAVIVDRSYSVCLTLVLHSVSQSQHDRDDQDDQKDKYISRIWLSAPKSTKSARRPRSLEDISSLLASSRTTSRRDSIFVSSTAATVYVLLSANTFRSRRRSLHHRRCHIWSTMRKSHQPFSLVRPR